MTYDQIGKILGVSRQRIHQIYKKNDKTREVRFWKKYRLSTDSIDN